MWESQTRRPAHFFWIDNTRESIDFSLGWGRGGLRGGLWGGGVGGER